MIKQTRGLFVHFIVHGADDFYFWGQLGKEAHQRALFPSANCLGPNG
jgi:hypothetical protein